MVGQDRRARIGWYFSVLLLMGLRVATTSFCQQESRTALQYYSKGLRTESLSGRIKYFEKAVALDPDFDEAAYQLGICYFRRQEFNKTIQSLSRVRNLDAASLRDAQLYLRNAYTFYAQDRNQQEEYEAALYAAQEAVRLDDAYAPALTILGRVQFSLRNWPAAIQALSKSVRLDPEQEQAWNALGDALMRVEEYAAAGKAYEKALQLDPGLKQAQFHLNIAKKRNRPQAWLQRYDEAIKDGNLELAKDHLEKALASHPNHEIIQQKLQEVEQELHYTAALQAVRTHDWTTALALLQKIDPDFKEATALLENVRARLTPRRRQPVPDASPGASAVQPSAQPKPSGLLSQQPPRPPSRLNRERASETVADEPRLDTELEPALASNRPRSHRRQAQSDVVDSAPGDNPHDDVPAARPTPPAARLPGVNGTGAVAKGSPLPWVLTLVGGVLLFGLIILGLRRTHSFPNLLKETLRERDVTVVPVVPLPRMEDRNGEETFHDKIASETPITFDPLNTTAIFDKTSEQKSTPTPEETLLHLRETRTIQSDIRKARRVGRYVIEKEIGRGSMGLVFKAWDPKLDRTVVIKQVAFFGHAQPGEVTRLKDRLYREARAAGKLNHPNIVIIYDVEEENDSSYIVMEYLEGEDLKSLLDRQGKVALVRAGRIIGQICQALDFAHQNDIVHRDIKPSNIILLENDKVKVADFGIAKMPQLGTLTQTGDIIGTPFYMSPEQIEGRKVDGRSDIFSTGVLLYEMVTGIRPFDGDTIASVVYKIVNQFPKLPSQENRRLPAELDLILEKALAKAVGERFQTATELLHELRRLDGEIASNEM